MVRCVRGRPTVPASQPSDPVDDNPVLADLVRRLVDELHPTSIYLFGSRARGDATADSDYDSLVLVPAYQDRPLACAQRARRALLDVGVSKDVLVMTTARFEFLAHAPASLPGTVKREGRLLYAA